MQYIKEWKFSTSELQIYYPTIILILWHQIDFEDRDVIEIDILNVFSNPMNWTEFRDIIICKIFDFSFSKRPLS
jgi:hypothetical protein